MERNDTSSPTSLNTWPDSLDATGQFVMRAIELRRVGALERIDRLFAVAHREDRAGTIARARTCEELLGQRMGDAPLLRRGVLHLVQQQMVEAAVELVKHPGGSRIEQQRPGAVDQVVVVEQPGRFLPPGVAAGNRAGQRRQRA